MCGIGGIFNRNMNAVKRCDLETINQKLSHRGPDGSGIWIDGQIGLAHTRLSIIDLSEQGKQPMCNENETIWITFNGEIYNYKELRQQLIANGHLFKSDTDTEIIVHLYEEKGIDCLDDLRGMFAFAIWDSNIRQLLLARDRIGKKPLYYTVQNGSFVFASELKAIKALPWVTLNFEAEIISFVFSYDYVPWPKTMYSNIYKLPPSSYLLVNENGIGKPEKYWSIDLRKKSDCDEKEAIERFIDIMKESINIRLRSDVPLGMFLSGGIDSSFIVGLSSKLIKEQISTFSIGYKDSKTNDPEYHFSKEVAKRFNTNHNEIVFDKNIVKDIPKILSFYDEPFCIPNAIAHYQLCRETRKSVSVALSGDGSDEILGGYDIYKILKLIDLISMINPNRDRANKKENIGKIKNNYLLAYHMIKTPRAFRRGFLKRVQYENMVEKIYSPAFSNCVTNIKPEDIIDQFYLDNNPIKFIDGVLYTDLLINYAWATTIATDIAGMSNSLEVRSPFLDHKLVEFVFTLPVNMKIGKLLKEKALLYKAADGFLPEKILKRKKMSYGSGIPYQKFFFNEWLSYVKEIIFDEKIKKLGYFNLKQVHDELFNGPQDNRNFRILWRLFCICLWLHGNVR